MKKHFYYLPTFLFSFVLGLTVNAQPLHVSLKTPKTFSQLPLVKTNKLPDLYAAGDSIPHNFIKTHIVELNYSYQASTNDMIKALRQRGLDEGVDGILLDGLGDSGPGTTSYSSARVYGRGQQRSSDYITTTSGYSSIKGVGIKYTDRINYLDTIVKHRQISGVDSNGNVVNKMTLDYEISGRLQFDGNGKNNHLFEDSIMPFDIQMAFNLQSNLYEASTINDFETGLPTINKISAKYGYQNADYHLKDLDNKYMFKAVLLNDATGERKKYKVQPVFNEQNILVGANVYNGNSVMYQIKYTLGLKNRVEQEDWKIALDGVLKPWIQISNSYYTNDSYLNDFQ